jgi:hypothetical protein
MKKFTLFKLPALVLGLLLFSMSGWAQGFESFNNSSATASYLDGSFIGDNGFTWTFGHSRDESTFPITGKGLMLRRASDSYLEAVIPGGIGTFSFEYRKAFTGTSVRQLELIINGVQVATTPEFGPTEPDPTIYSFTVNNVNSEGNVTVKIKNVGTTTTNRQTVIDNIEWTGYSGGTPLVATPTFNPPAGIYYSPQNVAIATETPGASIYYTTDGTDPDEFSNAYVNPIPVSVTTTIKAKAYAAGYDPSAIATAVYNFPVDVADIATLRAGATDGSVYRLTGEAILTAKDAFNNRKFIEDATAAIMIFDSPGTITTEYNIGDGIKNITGTLSLVNQMLRFIPTQDPGAAFSVGNPVSPATFSIDLLTSGDQAKLVKLENVTFTAPGTFANGQNYTITDGINNLVFRTDFWNVDYIGTSIPELPQNITGVIIQFNDVIQIVARNLADFELPAIPWPVTFYLDMTNEVGTFTTVDVAGTFNGWGSPGDVLTLLGNNIYEYTTAAIFNEDDVIQFKFRKDGNWGTSEPDPNRSYTVVAGTNVYHAVYGVMVPAEIGFANLQWPPAGSIDLGWNYDVYAQVYADGLTGTQNTNPTPNLGAWIGFSTTDTDPATWTNWVPASFNVESFNNDEFVANIGAAITEAGTYYYASRFKLGLADYVYGGYNESGGGFWDGINNVSGILTVNIDEPDNHVMNFMATADSYSAITLTWTDSDAAGYLIKGSAVSYAAIDNPVDGTPEADGGLVQNVATGIELHQFAGLMAETDYFFKIFPYNGTAGAINYKTDGIVPEATAQTGELPGYLVGDYGFTATSGNWGSTGNWRQWDGTGWNTTVAAQPTIADNVYILGGNTAIVEASGKNAKNLFVEAGAKLYANNATMTGPRYVNVTGDIICDGMIGNGSGVDDVISFNINGTSCTISGVGSFTGNRMRKNATGNSSLAIWMDIEVRYNGLAFYNQAAVENTFYVTIQPGVHLNCTGNGVTPNGGYQLKSNDNLIIYGQVTLTGNLDNQAGTGGVVIKSNASGSGSLIQPNVAEATVERYFTGNDVDWHLVSSPVAGATADVFNGMFLQDFDPLTYTYTDIVDPATMLNVMEGYALYSTLGASNTVSFDGNLNAGNQSASFVTGFDAYNWNLLGNPYPSSIDWELVTIPAGMSNEVHYIDAATGADLSYVQGVGGAGSQYIPPMQGFFVSATTGGTFSVGNDQRTHMGSNLFYKNSNPDLVVLEASNGSFSDEAWIHFNQMAEVEHDGKYDAYKRISQSNPLLPQIFSYTPAGVKLSVNGMPEVQSVPVGFTAVQSGEFTISANETGGFSELHLEDLFNGSVTNLLTGSCSFLYNEGDLENRFILHFAPLSVNSSIEKNVNIWSYGNEVTVMVPELTNGIIRIYNMMGQEVITTSVTSSRNTITVPQNGYYVVTVVSDQTVVTEKVIIR